MGESGWLIDSFDSISTRVVPTASFTIRQRLGARDAQALVKLALDAGFAQALFDLRARAVHDHQPHTPRLGSSARSCTRR